MSDKYTYTDEIHEKPFQKGLFEVITTPARDKLLMTLSGVSADQLDKIYSLRKGPNPDVDKIVLSPGNIKSYDGRNKEYLAFNQKEQNFFNNLSTVSQASINSLRNEFGTSYVPSIKFNENNFVSSWSEIVDEFEIKNLLDGQERLPNQKHYSLDNGNELHDRVMNLLNWEGNKDYISLVFLFPFKSKINIKDGSEIRWDIFDGAMSGDSKQADIYALILAIQLLYVNKNDNTLCRNIIDISFMKKYFTREGVLNYTVLAEPLNLSGLRNAKLDKGQIIQTAISPEKNIVDFKYKKVLYNNNARQREDLDTMCNGLKLLMSNVPGIACKLNIPASDEFKKLNKSSTWVFGPRYWIEFLENSNAGSKDGSKMRKQSMELDDNGQPKSAVYYC